MHLRPQSQRLLLLSVMANTSSPNSKARIAHGHKTAIQTSEAPESEDDYPFPRATYPDSDSAWYLSQISYQDVPNSFSELYQKRVYG